MTFRPADVKAVRDKLKASQTEFALMIGVSVATLRNWEQGRRMARLWRSCASPLAIRGQSPRRYTGNLAKAQPNKRVKPSAGRVE
jgi:hypothetical protein